MSMFATNRLRRFGDLDHAVALAPNEAVNIMHDMCLVTKETFDRFLIALLSWYKEESYEVNELPNLFEIFYYHEPYTKIFFEIFAESLAWRNTYQTSKTDDYHIEFTEEERSYYSKLLSDNFDRLQSSMIYDFERTMRGLGFVYRWDSTMYGGNDRLVKNNAVLEVW